MSSPAGASARCIRTTAGEREGAGGGGEKEREGRRGRNHGTRLRRGRRERAATVGIGYFSCSRVPPTLAAAPATDARPSAYNNNNKFFSLFFRTFPRSLRPLFGPLSRLTSFRFNFIDCCYYHRSIVLTLTRLCFTNRTIVVFIIYKSKTKYNAPVGSSVEKDSKPVRNVLP